MRQLANDLASLYQTYGIRRGERARLGRALASACVLFALWIAREHLASYPEPAIARYLDMLMNSPWAPAPGLSLHPSESEPLP